MENKTQMSFEIQNSFKIIASNNKVIHIYKDTDKGIRGWVIEQRVIGARLAKPR